MKNQILGLKLWARIKSKLKNIFETIDLNYHENAGVLDLLLSE